MNVAGPKQPNYNTVGFHVCHDVLKKRSSKFQVPVKQLPVPHFQAPPVTKFLVFRDVIVDQIVEPLHDCGIRGISYDSSMSSAAFHAAELPEADSGATEVEQG